MFTFHSCTLLFRKPSPGNVKTVVIRSSYPIDADIRVANFQNTNKNYVSNGIIFTSSPYVCSFEYVRGEDGQVISKKNNHTIPKVENASEGVVD